MPRGRYTFDAEHFVVVTPFEWNGRHFNEGEAFPWREIGLVELQRRHLWVANKIDVAPAPPADGPKPTLPVETPKQKRQRAAAPGV